jgi:hypothetical protein
VIPRSRLQLRSRTAPAACVLCHTVLLVAALCVTGGCATRSALPPTSDIAIRPVPNDFAFALAVPAGLEPLALYPEQAEVLRRPAWFIVEPDGTLRAALGPPQMDGPVPPRVRRLSPAQRLELFTLLDERGALTPWTAGAVGMGIPVGDASSVVSGDDGASAIGVWWSAFGRSRSFAVLPASQGSDGEPAWNTVRDALALLERWAWIDTDPASGVRRSR